MKTIVTYELVDHFYDYWDFPKQVVRFFDSTDQFMKYCNDLPWHLSVHYSNNLLDGCSVEIIENIKRIIDIHGDKFLSVYRPVKFEYEKDRFTPWFSHLSWDEYYWSVYHDPF